MTLATRIRRQLENPDGLTQEALQPLAEEYRQAVESVNERLLACVNLLRKGLRSEAIQRANLKPNIFDAAAELDLADIEDWIDILRFYGMSTPPLVDVGAIAELNEALVDEQPLEELLRQHRRLAIAKAPLSWRLKVLRKLSQLDTMNTVWYDDIVQWETIRLKQIANELTQAIESNSTTVLEQLDAELAYEDWKVPPPEQLRNKIKAATAKKVLLQQQDQAKGISESLHAAFTEGNEEAGIAAAQAWKNLLSTLKSPLPSEIQHEAAPALEWVENILAQRMLEADYRQKTDDLERLLQKTNSSKQDLERAMHSLRRLELGIDPVLQGRFNSRINELVLKDRRRQQLMIVSVIATVALLAASGGLWYWRTSFTASVNEAAVAMQTMLDTGKLSEAEGLFANLPSGIKSSTKISSIAERMNSLIKQDKERQDRIEQLIRAADNEDPSKIDITKVNEGIKLAKTDSENRKLNDLKRRWEALQMDLESKDVKAIQTEIAQVESELTRIQNQPVDTNSLQDVTNLLGELEKLSETYPRGVLTTSRLINITIERAKNLRTNLQEKQRKMSQVEEIMNELRTSNSIANYERLLKRYAEKQADGPFSRELKAALKNSERWSITDKFNTSSQEIGNKLEQGLTVSELLAAKQSRTELDTAISNLPGKKESQKLTILARYASERENALRNLRNEATRSPFSGIVTLVNSASNKRLFTSDQARNQFANQLANPSSSTKLEIPQVIDSSGNLGEKPVRGKHDIKPEPRNTVKSFAQGIGPSQSQTLTRWEDVMIKQVGDTLKNEDLDATLKRRLLLILLNSASAGSRAIDQAFTKVRSMLTSEEDEKNWHVDKAFESSLSKELESAVKNAAIEVKNLRAEDREALSVLGNARLLFVGGMLPKTDSLCEPTVTLNQPPDGVLYVLLNTGNAGSFDLIRLGKIQARGIVRDQLSANLNLDPWSPLFCDPSGQ
jgi:5-bromo-4-chloroindolyl phosphate hydrolysis protein